MVKFPVLSVRVAWPVPLSVTDTPARAVLSSKVDTFPVIVLSCAKEAIQKSRQGKKSVSRLVTIIKLILQVGIR
jgi:hypothetical protein